MENVKDNVQQQGSGPVPPPYVPPGIERKEFLRTDARYKSPILAAIMSLMPGLGQIYVGYYQQGFINIITVAGVIAMLNPPEVHYNIKSFLGLFLAFFWMFNMVDAYRKATFYNQALAGIGPFEIPEGDRFSGARGSLFGGALLILAGAIALGYTRFGMSIEWIEEWWPLGLILMGAYLLSQSILQKKKKTGR